jgi:acetyl-CoA synthetase
MNTTTSGSPLVQQKKPAYADAYLQFDTQTARRILGDTGSGINAAVRCCDRYRGSDRTALYWCNKSGRRTEYTFEQLHDLSDRFSQVLRDLGVGVGDKVAGLLPRIPELVATVLAVWRLGAVYQPLLLCLSATTCAATARALEAAGKPA